VPHGVQAVVNNPPFKLAIAFVAKAIIDAPYVALLLRLNFLESVGRLPFFRKTPPARIWVSSGRLPMMHRLGWDGRHASSNHCFAWFVWERGAASVEIKWFDWGNSDDPNGAKLVENAGSGLPRKQGCKLGRSYAAKN
jgi:hypothetical protein